MTGERKELLFLFGHCGHLRVQDRVHHGHQRRLFFVIPNVATAIFSDEMWSMVASSLARALVTNTDRPRTMIVLVNFTLLISFNRVPLGVNGC